MLSVNITVPVRRRDVRKDAEKQLGCKIRMWILFLKNISIHRYREIYLEKHRNEMYKNVDIYQRFYIQVSGSKGDFLLPSL